MLTVLNGICYPKTNSRWFSHLTAIDVHRKLYLMYKQHQKQ